VNAFLYHYESLGIKKTASAEEIERAHTKLVEKLRVSQVEDALEELSEVEEAYVVLRDPEKRAKYDVLLRQEEGEDEEEAKAAAGGGGRRYRHGAMRGGRGLMGFVDALFALLKLFR